MLPDLTILRRLYFVGLAMSVSPAHCTMIKLDDPPADCSAPGIVRASSDNVLQTICLPTDYILTEKATLLFQNHSLIRKHIALKSRQIFGLQEEDMDRSCGGFVSGLKFFFLLSASFFRHWNCLPTDTWCRLAADFMIWATLEAYLCRDATGPHMLEICFSLTRQQSLSNAEALDYPMHSMPNWQGFRPSYDLARREALKKVQI